MLVFLFACSSAAPAFGSAAPAAEEGYEPPTDGVLTEGSWGAHRWSLYVAEDASAQLQGNCVSAEIERAAVLGGAVDWHFELGGDDSGSGSTSVPAQLSGVVCGTALSASITKAGYDEDEVVFVLGAEGGGATCD